jgi:uncharacterized cupredoxin-like copper-binding protein
MKILFSIIVSAAISFGVARAEETVTEKAKDAVEDTAEATKDAAKKTAKTVKKAVKSATSKVSGHHINVTMTEYHFDMPTTAKAGKTTFMIKNSGKKAHAFEIKGQGIDQKLSPNVKAGETRTLEVDLKPGTYNITCPMPFHPMRGMKSTLTVK